MSIARHHNEWLTLVPNSGPFLSLPVLTQVFPQGLNAHDAEHARRLRMAFGEWDDDQAGPRPDSAIHRAWIKFVLAETLGFEELLAEGQAIPQTLKTDISEYGETLRPDWIVNDPATKKARLLVQTYPRAQSLTKPVLGSRWKASPDTRMMQLLHDTSIRLGLVTNGDHWMLVNAPKHETSGYVSWYANLWLEEPVTLRAIRTLLCAERFFGVQDTETIEALLDRSADDQQEVTDQLGYQVRKAVEVLIQSLDKADEDHGRKLLADVDEKVLYEAALTVMMRLVFLFCAEERELLLLGDDLWDKNYAVSTLREQLRATADQHGEEILGLRYDAWTRLLTTFRAVYGGVKHDRFKLPAYGGSLFHPDRFPFLEGRKRGTTWKDAEATPLPVSNRTVLHLLEALQVLQVRLPGGGPAEARKLSFRELGIEQIGHVYEGLLDHTAKRATEPVLGLQGTRDKEPEIALADLEKLAAKGEKELLKFLKDKTGRSESALKKGLDAEIEDQLASRFRTACQDSALCRRVQKFAGLVRLDTTGYPVVITKGSVFVTSGTDRRSSGTHYTPKSLTEPIVQYTLEPLVYVGPAEGLPKQEWKLRSAKELLDLKICDMACGSGAFLVQACRYMAERLMEAWEDTEKLAQVVHQDTLFEKKDRTTLVIRITPYGMSSKGGLYEQLVPIDADERQTYALRIVAQRCLYGVDKNPLAAEMAKLSLWLLTLAKDKPFEFLDHAIRCGDSLVGISNLDQLRKFDLDGKGQNSSLFLQFLDPRIKEAVELRRQLESMQANTVEEVQAQERLLQEANEKMERLKCAADMLVGAEFLRWEQHELIEEELRDEERDDNDGDRPEPGWMKAKKATEQFRRAARLRASIETAAHFNDSELDTFRYECQMWLNGQPTFHWPLEFPEVLVERGGFDALLGNPPFMGGTFVTGTYGVPYREFLVHILANDKRGNADLCAYFFLRSFQVLRATGKFGLVATNTIAQGDTRDVGLEQLLANGGVITRAVPSRPWPGEANLEVAHVWLRKCGWMGMFVLNDQPADGITAFLTAPSGVSGKPFRLKANESKSFTGCKIYGQGFVLSPEEAQSLLDKDCLNKEVLCPYLDGEDVNSRHDQSPSRWVINFWAWPLEKAQRYADCFQIVEQKVKPERAALRETADGQRLKEKWWLYGRSRPELYQAIYGHERVFVAVLHTKYWSVACYHSSIVFSHALAVFSEADFGTFSVLESFLHESWARVYSSSLETRMRYTPSDCFETFPFPDKLSGLDSVGKKYDDYRRQLMNRNHEGLTKTYNRFHDPDELNADIQKLRQLHVEMDNAVAAVYGWADLNLDHGFHETKQGIRYTISELARREVLARLLKLNHERYAEEVKQVLHDSKGKKSAGGGKRKLKQAVEPVAATPSLYDSVVDTAFPSTDRDRLLCGMLCDLVAAQESLEPTAYLDAMVIALRYKRHGGLLIGNERKQFARLSGVLPKGCVQSADKIPWMELLELLSRLNALCNNGTHLERGNQFDDVRPAYPACDTKLIQLIHKAAARLRELQSSAKPDTEQELPKFKEDLQALYGGSP